MKEIKLPLRYDSEGQYIFDRENKMILEIRGWGWIQKLNPKDIQQTQSEYQDSLGKLIVRLLNDGLLDTDCRHCSVYSKCFAADVEIDNEETTIYYTDVHDYCLEYQREGI